MSPGSGPDPCHQWSLMVSGVTDTNTEPGCCRATDPEMALGGRHGLNDTVASVDSSAHPNWPDSGGATALRSQHGHRLQHRSWASTWPLVATWAREINTNSGCHRTMDPDMVLNCSLVQVVTIASGGCVGYPDCHAPLRQHIPQTLPWPQVVVPPQAPTWPSVTTEATGINRGLSCSRAQVKVLALGHSPGPDISLNSGGHLSFHASSFLTTLTSPNLHLSPAHKTFYLSLPSTCPPCTLTTMVSNSPVPGLLVG